MWVPHLKKKKNKNKKLKSKTERQIEMREISEFFLNFSHFLSFSDSRVSDRQNSSG